ncbi:sugar phosphate nucleotidyltransferase [Paenibacillus sp. JX-17]|uniref:Sugar phosphate nucleotidyltransferase n=1 Tax=Paenibacillus lacisoli TaxID=3064525 RepID=A0ABT9CF62_9BACL|nr:sugar phosphate nucleotidyltransferase [Paenibacillus sp. JX-17]MDO7907208.1 sugar phosphate nucleotidyltransferase [Paenibacillus sp. JX-17]
MRLVLLSGGSGKRLWPLSNDARSKQFLKVLENENREHVSMVQRVWHQLKATGLSRSSMIATGKAQVEIMQAQVGYDVPLLIEPERRDTFPAIALAAAYLYSVEGIALNETVAILPVDPYVEDHFFEVVKSLDGILQASGADLALIGVQPTYNSSKYGYMIPEKEVDSASYRRVARFQEKPSEEEAELLITAGALWNCGVFAFKLDYLITLLEQKGLPIHYEAMLKHYDTLPKISFDYEVVEQAEKVVAVPYEGYWKDLGTWNTLTEEMGSCQMGKGILSSDCENTHLINETDIPVTVLGVSNIVVAASPDGILVTDKSSSPRIKDLINFNQGPMYEEREWGWSKILDTQAYGDGSRVVTRRISLQAGKNLGYRLNRTCQEVWTIVKGEAEFIHNGNLMRVQSGNVLHIPAKTMHGIRAFDDVEFIAVQTGPDISEGDAIELYKDWSEIERHCAK